MPYTIRKVRGKNCFRLMNKENKRVFSKCTTRKNAEKQLRLLNAIKYNKSFKPRNKTMRKRSKG